MGGVAKPFFTAEAIMKELAWNIALCLHGICIRVVLTHCLAYASEVGEVIHSQELSTK